MIACMMGEHHPKRFCCCAFAASFFTSVYVSTKIFYVKAHSDRLHWTFTAEAEGCTVINWKNL